MRGVVWRGLQAGRNVAHVAASKGRIHVLEWVRDRTRWDLLKARDNVMRAMGLYCQLGGDMAK